VSAFPSGKESGGSLPKRLYILWVTTICYENRSERQPRGSNRDKKRKRKLPESRYPRFRASDATHIESGKQCAAPIRAFEVHIRSDTLEILRMSALLRINPNDQALPALWNKSLVA
jgi:hypothetical protein